MLRAIILLSMTIFAGTSAFAADHGVYLGAAVSEASVDVNLSSGTSRVPIDGKNTKFKVIGGVRPLDWLAFEVNYVDFGSIDNTVARTRGEFKLKGLDAMALGIFEIAIVDLYAKGGVVRWDQTASLSNVRISSDTGYDMAYGGGVQLHFGSLSARAEYEKFNIQSTNTRMISVGLTWTFL
ncbi:MAG TPA: outer membrane beta-barrel protein [Steroidobacteraceae bacterium]|nr:outer membrane beta-barrel protein [Steroidobacteraceae bacterium]